MKDLTEKLTRAASWLEGRKWKLEESRSLADAGYEELTLTLNETADACPRDMLAAVVRAIEAAENGVEHTALEAEGAVHDGTWLLKRVDWRREGDGRNPPQDNRLQLYKRYVRVTDKNPAAHVMENNCFWVVTHMFRFNMAAIEAVPAGSSGVTYAIRGASADKETRLWDYVVEKREQLTTSTGVVTVEDDAFKTVYQRGWYGVRTGDKTHTGAAVALWDPAAQPAGTLVTTPFMQKNDNCTVDIIQRLTVAKAVANAKLSAEKTLFEETAEKTDVNQAAAVATAVAAAAGAVTRRWADKNPDGTYDNHERTVQEQAVEGTVRNVTRDAFGETVEVEDRGQPLPGDEDEVAPDGETLEVKNERTAGGWWRVIKRRVRSIFVADATVRYSRDMFEDVTEIGRKAAVSPLGVPPEAGGGVWREWLDKLRPDRKWDQNEVEHRERTVALAVREQTADAFEASETLESVAASELADVGSGAPAAGTIERRRSEVTKGGFWRRRSTVTRERNLARSFQSGADYFGTADSETGVADSVTLTAASGQSVRASASITPGGKLKYTKETVTESDVSKSYVSADDYFSSAAVEEGVADSVKIVAATGKSQRVSASVTPGGKLRYSKTTETAKAARAWTLVDKKAYGSDMMAGRVMDAVLVKLYANAELATARADAAAFIAAHHPFEIITGTMTDIHNYFYYQHQVGFGLHVNKYGKWDGTLTLRAVLTPGLVYTVAPPPKE